MLLLFHVLSLLLLLLVGLLPSSLLFLVLLAQLKSLFSKFDLLTSVPELLLSFCLFFSLILDLLGLLLFLALLRCDLFFELQLLLDHVVRDLLCFLFSQFLGMLLHNLLRVLLDEGFLQFVREFFLLSILYGLFAALLSDLGRMLGFVFPALPFFFGLYPGLLGSLASFFLPPLLVRNRLHFSLEGGFFGQYLSLLLGNKRQFVVKIQVIIVGRLLSWKHIGSEKLRLLLLLLLGC